MQQFIRFIAVWSLCLIAGIATHAQVGASLNEQNLKIPKVAKTAQVTKEVAKKKGVPEATIDTTTAYFKCIDTAQTFITQKNWGKAEEYIRKAIVSDPANHNNSLLLSNLATLQRYQGKLAEAVKNYSMALDMTPNAVTLLNNRASLYVELDSVALAKADYEHIIKIDPGEAEAHYNLGMLALAQNDLKEADAQFEEILRYHPNSALANEGKAFLSKAAGNYAKAADYFSDIIKKKPTASMLGNRADCYLMLKRLNDASDDIKSALQIAPDDGYLYVLRAKLNKLRYEIDAAKRDVQLAIEHGIDPKIAVEAIK